MHPEQQRRILGRVARAGRKRPGRLAQLAVHARVDRANGRDGMTGLERVAERQRQHRLHCLVQPANRRHRARAEVAVVGHTRRDERVRHLQQDGARPSKQDQPLRIDAMGYHRAIMP